MPPQLRLGALDGLRGISILLVVLGHLANTTSAPRWLGPTATYADFGVRVFFVISGFLITTLLEGERARTGSIDLGQFYLRRFFRIFPAAYAFITVMVFVSWRELTALDVTTAYAYLSNFHPDRPWILGHLWSLSVEEQFYLLWPFAFALAYRRRIPLAALAVLASPLVRLSFIVLHRPIGTSFPVMADALATGCLLAMMRTQLERFRPIIARRWFLMVPVLTMAAVQLRYVSNSAYYIVGLPAIHVGIALTIEHCRISGYRLLEWKPLTALGILSYSLYLWQQPFLVPRSGFSWHAFPANILAAVAVASASYYAIERPLLAVRDRLRERAKQGALPRGT